MNTGVSTVPWAVAMIPRRARPSVCVTRKENAGGGIGRYSLQFDLETQRTTKGWKHKGPQRDHKGPQRAQKHREPQGAQRTHKGSDDSDRRSLSLVSFVHIVSF